MNDPAPVSTVGILVDWETWEPNMRANLLFVVQGNRVLLIHKKRGIGAGKINGPGGKLEAGESPLEAAIPFSERSAPAWICSSLAPLPR